MKSSKIKHILLVEDHIPDAKTLERVMHAMTTPHVLHLVSDGSEALRFLRRVDRFATAPIIDLVLLDLNLPRVSGYEVLAAVRDDEKLRTLPFIVLTGSELSQDVEQCYRLGANAYVVKPGSPNRALAFVKALDEFWFVQGRTPSSQ